MSGQPEHVGNGDLWYREDEDDGGRFQRIILWDDDDGSTIILDKDTIKSLRDRLDRAIKEHKL